MNDIVYFMYFDHLIFIIHACIVNRSHVGSFSIIMFCSVLCLSDQTVVSIKPGGLYTGNVGMTLTASSNELLDDNYVISLNCDIFITLSH
jgi:hypothetical protein